MNLTYQKERARFEVKTSWAEFQEHGAKIKGARFRWDPDTKVWWTDDASKASLLISCADETSKGMLRDLEQNRAQALDASRAKDAEVPGLEGLGLTPFPFQRAGISYAMLRNAVLFGDDPGLGKTLQSLTVVHLKHSYPCIAVVPATLKINWRNEAVAAIPELRPEGAILILSGRPKKEQRLGPVYGPPPMLYIVNYDIVKDWLPALLKVGAQSLIMDESHFAKNPKSLRCKACRELAQNIEQRYLLSGTAELNKPKELLPQLEILGVIDKWGGPWQYLKRFCGGVMEQVIVAPHWKTMPNGQKIKMPGGLKNVWNFDGSSNELENQRLLREHCMVRRLKQDVLTELPPKRHQVIEIPANGLADLVTREREANERWDGEIERLKTEREWADVTEDHTSFEEACHGLQVAQRASFTEMAKLAHDVAVAKVPKALEFILETCESVKKMIVFIHHHDVCDLLNAGLTERGVETAVLTGRENATQKDASVVAFQEGSAKVMIVSIMAGGLGLNLHAAPLVIFVELLWVPGVMSQAYDRIHRIGQKADSVLAQYLVLEGSLDCNKINKLINKGRIIRATMDDELPDFTVPGGEPEAVKARAVHQYSDSEKSAMLGLLRMLSSVCDGARVKDEMGFNGIDSRYGKALSALPCLSDKQAGFAKRILKKYHGQVYGDLFKVVYPDFQPE